MTHKSMAHFVFDSQLYNHYQTTSQTKPQWTWIPGLDYTYQPTIGTQYNQWVNFYKNSDIAVSIRYNKPLTVLLCNHLGETHSISDGDCRLIRSTKNDQVLAYEISIQGPLETPDLQIPCNTLLLTNHVTLNFQECHLPANILSNWTLFYESENEFSDNESEDNFTDDSDSDVD